MGTVGLALVAAPASAEDSKPKPKTTTTRATWLALPPDPQRDIARNTVSGVPR
jgi:hypothetical protein